MSPYLLAYNPAVAVSKGGHSYLLLYDTTKKEVLGQYVSPPTKQSKSVGVDGGFSGATVGFNYQSSIEYDKSIVVENTSNTTGLNIETLTPNVNEYLKSEGRREVNPIQNYKLDASKTFIAGCYVMPVAPDIENPAVQSHFVDLGRGVEMAMDMFLEFIIKSFWADKRNYRASIFLHDAVNRQLKMRVGYHMTGDKDFMLTLPDTAGSVGLAFTKKTSNIADFNLFKHEDRNVDSSDIWPEMKSILALPITDNDEIALGALSIDSSDNYVDAKFLDRDINTSLQILCRGLGRMLEAYSV